MAAEFTFVAGDERLEVRIIGFETSALEKENVGNRLGSTIAVSIGAFTGSFKAAFTTGGPNHARRGAKKRAGVEVRHRFFQKHGRRPFALH